MILRIHTKCVLLIQMESLVQPASGTRASLYEIEKFLGVYRVRMDDDKQGLPFYADEIEREDGK